MINSSSSQKEDDLEVDESGAYYKFNKKMNENKNNFYEDKMNTNVRLSSESDGKRERERERKKEKTK